MTHVRIKGFQIFKDRHGKQRCYHRASKTAIDLTKAPLGSAEFLAECARVAAMYVKPAEVARPGTLGPLIEAYRQSDKFKDLAPRTKADYLNKVDFLAPLAGMPLTKIDRPFVVQLRDKAVAKGGRRFGNYVKAVLSVMLVWGAERGFIATNPAENIKNVPRAKSAPRANRPWTDAERFAVLDAAPPQIRVPIALGMYLGLREGDALRVTWAAIKDGEISLVTAKAGTTVRLPISTHLAEILAEVDQTKAGPIALTSRGQPWTESGFRASWRTLRVGLEKDGRIDPGLTFHGLRHTVATILRENGVDPRLIADSLGQKTEGMALHYSRQADLSKTMKGVGEVFEASETRARAGRVESTRLPKTVKPKQGQKLEPTKSET